ncbi:MAG TPA: hypothetical protein VGJ20_46775 [Xanthobacteraceae bacterium]|jgi:hypothetical protein
MTETTELTVPPRDPVCTALEKHQHIWQNFLAARDAMVGYQNTHSTADGRLPRNAQSKKLCQEEKRAGLALHDSICRLCQTVPTTLPGVIGMIRAAEADMDGIFLGYMDDGRETEALFLASIRTALERISLSLDVSAPQGITATAHANGV